MATLLEETLSLGQLVHELLVASRTHLPGQQSLVQEALMCLQRLIQPEGLVRSDEGDAGGSVGCNAGRCQSGGWGG